MPEKEPWYMQPAAGFYEMEVGNDLIFVDEVNEKTNRASGSEKYSRIVHATVGDWRSKGWSGWIAAECQDGYAGAKQHWIWAYPKDGRYLEYIWSSGNDIQTIEEECKIHRGRGWRFPLVIFFSNEPTSPMLDVLKKWKVPFVVQPEFYDPNLPGPFPPDDDDFETKVLDKLDQIIELL